MEYVDSMLSKGDFLMTMYPTENPSCKNEAQLCKQGALVTGVVLDRMGRFYVLYPFWIKPRGARYPVRSGYPLAVVVASIRWIRSAFPTEVDEASQIKPRKLVYLQEVRPRTTWMRKLLDSLKGQR